MKVRELMNSNVVSLRPEDTAAQAAVIFNRHGIGALPVCAADGRLRGMVTDRDIVLRCVACEGVPEETPLREIMTRGVVCISPEADVREATQLMASEQVRRLPVVEEGRIVGMLALGDLACSHAFDMEASKALAEISEKKH